MIHAFKPWDHERTTVQRHRHASFLRPVVFVTRTARTISSAIIASVRDIYFWPRKLVFVYILILKLLRLYVFIVFFVV